jgi:hypothetical protein
MTLGKTRFEHSRFRYVSFTSAALFVKEKQKRWYDVNAPPIGSDGIAAFFVDKSACFFFSILIRFSSFKFQRFCS